MSPYYFILDGVVKAALRRYVPPAAVVAAALAYDPNDVEALVNYGIILLSRRDLDGASRTLERAASLEPRYANTYFNMGLVYEARGDFASAAASYRRGLQLEPGNAEAQRRLEALATRP